MTCLERSPTPSTPSPIPVAAGGATTEAGFGPSRWLLVVVSYEQEPARILTAVALRKDPKQWRP